MQKSYGGVRFFYFAIRKSRMGEALQGLAETAVTTVLAVLQILPLRAHGLVVLHLRHGLGIAEAIALELLNQVIEDEGIGTFLAILRQHTY